MNTAEATWNRLAKSKKYREEFALSLLKRSVAFQIKTLRKKHCGSQAVLAERAKLTQGVVSRAEDQDYGNLTFNTVGRIAAGLDMAFVGKFIPFSALVRYSLELSEAELENIPTFESEQQSEPKIVEGDLVKALASGTHLKQLEGGETGPSIAGWESEQELGKSAKVIPFPRRKQGAEALGGAA